MSEDFSSAEISSATSVMHEIESQPYFPDVSLLLSAINLSTAILSIVSHLENFI